MRTRSTAAAALVVLACTTSELPAGEAPPDGAGTSREAPRMDGGAGPGGGSRPDACPETAPEACDGLDNDCDGLVDVGAACLTPPEAACRDETTLRGAAAVGACVAGACVYPEEVASCAFGCEDGACRPDPCDGVTCDAPPPPACADAGTLVRHAAPGSCAGGACVYAEVAQSCAFGCADGACLPDPCAGVDCDAPPPPECAGVLALVLAAAPGACVAGGCVYPEVAVPCAFGCTDGACRTDPCAGVACDAPPPAPCLDGRVLRRSVAPGACVAGGCVYPEVDIECAFGCEDGACLPDPCAGVSCTARPRSVCVDGDTLRRSASPGVCVDGACVYPSVEFACALGCANGACAEEACAGVVCDAPPAPRCLDARRVEQPAAAGACVAGACVYPTVEQICPFGCADGVCRPDPCAGVVCDAPPPATCLDGTTLRMPSATGVCALADCVYPSVDLPCPFGCAGGACLPDPCAGVTCDAPPPPECTGAATLRQHGSPGVCAGGVCLHGAVETACPLGCDEGGAACGDGVVCLAGRCAAGCVAGFGDCNGAAGDGCEVELLRDPDHCGACRIACPAVPDGTPGCDGGECGVGECDADRGDCDGEAANGCETDLSVEVGHCGGCGRACAEREVCVGGACEPGFPATCLAYLRAGLAEGDGVYRIDPTGGDPGDAFDAWCDMTTGGGGFTLVAWTGDSGVAPLGVPYPGVAPCPTLDCRRGSAAGPAAIEALLQASTELAKAQSTVAMASFAALGDYQRAGRYDYRSLAGLDLRYAPTVCDPAGLAAGTFTALVGPADLDGTAVFLAQHLAYASYDYSSDANSYIWNVGTPTTFCNGSGTPPGTWMGTWNPGQYGPHIPDSRGAHAVFAR